MNNIMKVLHKGWMVSDKHLLTTDLKKDHAAVCREAVS